MCRAKRLSRVSEMVWVEKLSKQEKVAGESLLKTACKCLPRSGMAESPPGAKEMQNMVSSKWGSIGAYQGYSKSYARA